MIGLGIENKGINNYNCKDNYNNNYNICIQHYQHSQCEWPSLKASLLLLLWGYNKTPCNHPSNHISTFWKPLRFLHQYNNILKHIVYLYILDCKNRIITPSKCLATTYQHLRNYLDLQSFMANMQNNLATHQQHPGNHCKNQDTICNLSMLKSR